MVKVIRINRGDDHMTNEQAQQVLDEMQGLRPEQLKGESKKLFEAIMLIADERDKIKQEYDRDTHILQNQLDLANAENVKKDKQINIMAEFLNKRSWREHQMKDNICNCCNIENGEEECEKCIKQYFENQAKELLNK